MKATFYDSNGKPAGCVAGIHIEERPGEDAIEVLETFGCHDAAEALRLIDYEADLNQQLWIDHDAELNRLDRIKLSKISKPVKRSARGQVLKLAGRFAALKHGELLTNAEIGQVIEEEREEDKWVNPGRATNIVSRATEMARKAGIEMICERGSGYRRVKHQ